MVYNAGIVTEKNADGSNENPVTTLAVKLKDSLNAKLVNKDFECVLEIVKNLTEVVESGGKEAAVVAGRSQAVEISIEILSLTQSDLQRATLALLGQLLVGTPSG